MIREERCANVIVCLLHLLFCTLARLMTEPGQSEAAGTRDR